MAHKKTELMFKNLSECKLFKYVAGYILFHHYSV